jgi:hypothetical protein
MKGLKFMENKLIKVGSHDIAVKEYKGKRVITFKDIDECHERPEGTAGRNFRENKDHFIENEDYSFVKPADIQVNEIRRSEINNSGTYLITASGYLMLCKSLTDDKAWNIQRILVNTYFNAQDNPKVVSIIKAKEIEARLKNAQARKAALYVKMANNDALSPAYKQVLLSYATKELNGGEALLPLPPTKQGYKAGEIGAMFGLTGNKIGRLANANNLKIEGLGEYRKDKSQSSSREVDEWVYFDAAIPEFERILNRKAAHDISNAHVGADRGLAS